MKTTKALPLILLALSCASAAYADSFGSGANTFDIVFVTIGNSGNVADTTGTPSPAGSVPYNYRIDKFEISEQMIDKANALGGLGITKDTRGPDKPATTVTWNEIARFVNWLNTSSGSTPAYKFAIPPGEDGYDANANIQLWTPSDVGYNPNNLYRNSLARYFLPSVDEWYKAAYYDAMGGVYHIFPTGSDSIPDGIDFVGDPNFEAMFYENVFPPPGPNDITDVGVLSPYGTAGQGGNVYEWQETDVDLVNDSSSSLRAIRGGAWGNNFVPLAKDPGPLGGILPTGEGDPVFGSGIFGFRVASIAIPEPNTLLLVAIGSLFLCCRRIDPHHRRGAT